MIQFIIQCSISLLLYCFVGFFLRYSVLDKQKRTNSVIKLHPSYFMVGIVCTLAFNIPAIFLAIKEYFWFSLVLFSFSVLSVLLIFGYLNCRIYYDENGIIVGKNDEELLIATNNHVVEDATSLAVQFIDGETVNAQIKGTEYAVDLAVIAVPLTDIAESTFSKIADVSAVIIV